MCRLPEEMYKSIISHMANKDLKAARLVSKSWTEFATPHLYRHVVFSSVSENIANLRKLVDSPLSHYV